jgi:hypothetical protein
MKISFSKCEKRNFSGGLMSFFEEFFMEFLLLLEGLFGFVKRERERVC